MKPWFKQYDKGVPHSLRPYPDRTLLDIVHDAARQRPDHPALLFKGMHLSYKKLEQLSDAFAGALVALDIKKGDRVVLLLANCPQFVIAQLGVWKAGGIVVPVNPLYTESELEHILKECGAAGAVVLTKFYGKIRTLRKQCGIRFVIATSIKEHLLPIKRVLFTFFLEKKGGHRITLDPGDLWMDNLLKKKAGVPGPEVQVKPDDPALLMLTGGTTGTPKAALGTHRCLLITGMQLNSWFGVELADWDDVIMLLMPLFHVYGNIGIMATGLVGHNPLALVPDPRDLNDVIDTIRKVRPAFLPGVPTLFNALLNHRSVKAGKVDLRSIKLCITAASPLLAENRHRFETLTGGRIVEAYGLTESMLAAAVGPLHGDHRPGAVGVPLPDVEVKVIDMESGKDNLPPGEVGEVLMRAPQLMKCYWQNPSETADTIRDGWLHTADLGYLDEDGYLYIVDRKKDLIKPSGFQVWPREVEEVIASHPAVHEVGVAGVSDDYQGEAVKAWVVLREGGRVTSDEIRAYCREKIAAYKVPKHVEFRDCLPKSFIEKVLRRELVAK